MQPRAKLFISTADCEGVFGEGKWRLLCAVKELGSISKAAQSLGRSYRKAWGDIKRAEAALGQPLIIKARGGAAGGRSMLTDYCEKVLTAWAKHRTQMHAALEKSYKSNLQTIFGPPDLCIGGANNHSPRPRFPGNEAA